MDIEQDEESMYLSISSYTPQAYEYNEFVAMLLQDYEPYRY